VYDSDLTNKEWETISPIFTRAKKGRHLQKHNKHKLVNATRYISKTGRQWHTLPKEYPNYKTVYSFYNRAIQSGSWKEMTSILVQKTRLNAKRNTEPSYSLIDSQSVKTTSATEKRGLMEEKNQRPQTTHHN
jgi:transposase